MRYHGNAALLSTVAVLLLSTDLMHCVPHGPGRIQANQGLSPSSVAPAEMHQGPTRVSRLLTSSLSTRAAVRGGNRVPSMRGSGFHGPGLGQRTGQVFQPRFFGGSLVGGPLSQRSPVVLQLNAGRLPAHQPMGLTGHGVGASGGGGRTRTLSRTTQFRAQGSPGNTGGISLDALLGALGVSINNGNLIGGAGARGGVTQARGVANGRVGSGISIVNGPNGPVIVSNNLPTLNQLGISNSGNQQNLRMGTGSGRGVINIGGSPNGGLAWSQGGGASNQNFRTGFGGQGGQFGSGTHNAPAGGNSAQFQESEVEAEAEEIPLHNLLGAGGNSLRISTGNGQSIVLRNGGVGAGQPITLGLNGGRQSITLVNGGNTGAGRSIITGGGPGAPTIKLEDGVPVLVRNKPPRRGGSGQPIPARAPGPQATSLSGPGGQSITLGGINGGQSITFSRGAGGPSFTVGGKGGRSIRLGKGAGTQAISQGGAETLASPPGAPKGPSIRLGGAGGHTITLGTGAGAQSISLGGAGTQSVTLGGAGAQSVTLGGAGAQSITLGAGKNGGQTLIVGSGAKAGAAAPTLELGGAGGSSVIQMPGNATLIVKPQVKKIPVIE